MDLPGSSCPSPLQLRTFGSNRLCEKNVDSGCASVMISAGGRSYTKVRGKLAAYAYYTPDGFRRFGDAAKSEQDIDGIYVDGVTITHGRNPRTHVWTYAATGSIHGISPAAVACPEVGTDITKQPAFVGKNYICVDAARLVTLGSNRLWDAPIFTTLGNCVGDCPDDLTFCVTLDQATSDDLELRICADEPRSNEDVFIKSYDFYVQ